jgi:hypothetical protein
MNPYLDNRKLYYSQLPTPAETIPLYETDNVLLEAYRYTPARFSYGDGAIWIQDMNSRGFTMETYAYRPFANWIHNESSNRHLQGVSAFCGDVYICGHMYHYVYDYLARAWWLNQTGKHVDRFLFYDETEPWSRFIISLMLPKVEYVPRHLIHYCDSLYFFNNINNYRNDIHDYDPFPADELKKRRVHGPALKCKEGFLPELRAKVLNEVNNYPCAMTFEKVYVSRKNAPRRAILNEVQVENTLISKGFTVLYLEELSPIMQLKLWSSAKVIVTPHGAAESNMIAQSPDTILYEIDTLNSEVYHTLGKLLNVNHTQIYCLNKVSDDKYECDIELLLNLIGENEMTYHSHFQEDEIIHKKYLKDKRNGVFVELGAFNGIDLSNTLFFERELGWTGHLIEPLPAEFARLVVNRPNCECYNYAIELEEGPIDFMSAKAGVLSMSTDNVHKPALDFINKLGGYDIITVQGIPFKNIISADRVPRIDLFSIDVEDNEDKVFLTFDWNIKVGLFLVEMHDWNEEKNEVCRQLMRDHGYVFLQKVTINELWGDPNEYSPL